MRDLEKVCIQPKYNYCTGEERFTFIKLPKCLVEDEGFVELSMDAKLLWGAGAVPSFQQCKSPMQRVY